MHLTLVSADPECHHAIDEVANLLNGHVTVVARAHHLYDSPGDLILWHVTESSAAIATHLAAFGRPIVLLVTRQQLGPLGGPLLREPLPSLPHPIRFIIVPFDADDAVTILRTLHERNNCAR